MIKKVEFNNSKGEKIKGLLKQTKPSRVLLLIGHGFKSSKEHPATVGVTDRLYTMGHSSFSFDFSKSAQNFNLKEQVEDIIDIIRYFSIYKEFVLLAPSLGALSMVIAARQSAKVKGLIPINGFFGTAQLGGSIIKEYLLFRLLVIFNKQYKKSWNYFKQNYQPEKINCKVLVIHAQHDDVVFIAQSKTFFNKLAGKKEMYISESADHHLSSAADKQEIAEVIDRWLKKDSKVIHNP
ncbi:MAG TPA: alpha/beta hydrolase [Patescibacteria group bacterium]|nr:alpha/beta hydrolase [Patescibacteria group bacterium]